MRERKNGPATPLGALECGKCGCPNKQGDNYCSYCNAELSKATPGFKETLEQYLNYYLNRIRFQYKVPSYSVLLKMMLTTFFSSSLFVSGLYVIYFAINKSGGFAALCIGTLMALYGGAALYNMFGKKG